MLGPAPLLDACAPSSVTGLIEVIALSPEAGAERLGSLGPDAVVAFEADEALRDRLARIELPTLLWRTCPGPPPVGRAQRLVLSAGDQREAWRCVGLPVADRLYAATLAELPARAAWLGPATPRRAAYLDWFEHAQEPAAEGTDALVAVNMHDESEADFEPRAARALAEGRLLVSETLTPARGLEPGIDYLEARDLDDLFLAVESAVRDPHAFRRVRLRGHRKAELFRASRVTARLVEDLLLELDAVPPSSP